MKIFAKSVQASGNCTKALVIALSAGFLVASLPVVAASAHDRHGVRKAHHHGHHHKRRHRNNAGDVFAAGVIGLVAGAIIGDIHHHRRNRARVYEEVVVSERIYPAEPLYNDYREPRRLYREDRATRIYPEERVRGRRSLNDVGTPKVIRFEDETRSASLEPWSPGWKSYCRSKYRSFNAKSGTFLGYDGKRHFCVAR